MKKTLITLLTLSSVAVAEEPLTLSSPADTQQAGYTAFDFVLNDSYLSGGSDTWFETATEVNLNSITIKTANTWYRSGSVGLAIFQKDNTSTTASWDYVAKSDFKTRTLGEMTFNFTDTSLTSSASYTVVFYGNESAFSGLDNMSTLTSLAGSQTPNENAPIATLGMRITNPKDDDFALYLNTGAKDSGNYAPYVKFTVSPVPEPATGTLSLLALAGLCARRRK